jgi:4'-phosphopantetheinyl transferase EntD
MIRELLPPLAVAAEAYGDPPEARLHPAEEQAVALAVASRRREYTSVRHCARAALGELGVGYRPLVPGERGAPTWPAGVVGSMTHCAGFRAAAVARARDLAALGIDAETDQPLPRGMLPMISLPSERDRVLALQDRSPHVAWGPLLFSAKESVYKAWFPLTGRFLNFSEADITFDAEADVFEARLLVPGPVISGREVRVFAGRWVARAGLIATAIAVPQRARAISRTGAAHEFTLG